MLLPYEFVLFFPLFAAQTVFGFREGGRQDGSDNAAIVRSSKLLEPHRTLQLIFHNTEITKVFFTVRAGRVIFCLSSFGSVGRARMFATVLYHHRIRKPKAVKNDQEDYSDKYGELRPHESLPKHDIKI